MACDCIKTVLKPCPVCHEKPATLEKQIYYEKMYMIGCPHRHKMTNWCTTRKTAEMLWNQEREDDKKMIDEYIKRSDAVYMASSLLVSTGVKQVTADSAAKYAMGKLPAADVAPVVHGRWIKDDSGITHCSNCKKAPLCDGAEETVLTLHCPHCDALMDGKEPDD